MKDYRDLSSRAQAQLESALHSDDSFTPSLVERAICAIDNGPLQSCEECDFTWMPRSTWRDEEQPEGYEPDDQESCPSCNCDSLRNEVTRLGRVSERDGRRIMVLERQVEGLEPCHEALKWVAETVHQAHHDGPIEKCMKNTCDYAMKVLGRNAFPRVTRGRV